MIPRSRPRGRLSCLGGVGVRIKYLTCDGETVVEEEITKAEMFRDIVDESLFLECTRPDGDIFEIYMLDHLYEITD